MRCGVGTVRLSKTDSIQRLATECGILSLRHNPSNQVSLVKALMILSVEPIEKKKKFCILHLIFRLRPKVKYPFPAAIGKRDQKLFRL